MNRLAGATSPYLRQHAANPVDWYPWGEEALSAAQREGKPLFVSIGYASCHWCHVMAHESFEDPATAGDLNRSFVPVKVDREERPDVDAVYMAAVQVTTGSGGWPMSVFCTPDGRPFLGGTYFPPSDRHGMPAFRRVLAAVADAWRDRRAEVESQADSLLEAVSREVRLTDRMTDRLTDASAGVGGPQILAALVEGLGERFDPEWGGWGSAPKFPRPTLVELCLRHHRATGDAAARTMATTTLGAMAAGGIYDHLAGGFARYSTDRQWLVPHFEKMLTDQALLARAYLHGWHATGEGSYLQVATETLDFIVATLAAAGGGLCSSYDADADGIEGGHATFTPDEVRRVLSAAGRPELASAALEWYGVTEEGNWEGSTVLRRPLGAPLGRPEGVEQARRLLLEARRRRPQPARDEKVLTEWNAMAVSVLAEAAAATGSDRWHRAAVDVAEALFARSRRPDGRWLRSTGVPAFAADHAWLVDACTRLGELTGEARWTARAVEVAATMLDLFSDDDGSLCTTGKDADQLVVRPKDVLDGAVPSASSTAALSLLRLAALTGDGRLQAAGERLVGLDRPLLEQQPMAVADMVPALLLAEGGTEIVVAGERPDLLSEVRRHWLPDAVVAWGEPTASPLWHERSPGAAYVCHRFACAAPARDAATLAAQLG
ncbi:MAG: thioredoxin domain-containing protein [Acidimicrobiales bacterium]